MTNSQPAVALRPAEETDRNFFASLFASTREEEFAAVTFPPGAKQSLLEQQFAAQSLHYSRHYAGASHEVVLVDGEPGGRLIVAEDGGDLLIVDIALMPEHRGQGIGTRLLAPILRHGDEEGAAVTIHVEHRNPARHLYDRLGFTPVSDDGVYVLMRRLPPGSADQAKTAS